jgi:carboxylesterase type B
MPAASEPRWIQPRDQQKIEDCLYLNVFNQVGYARKHGGRSVMVWIYGGGLIAGEANEYYASKVVT